MFTQDEIQLSVVTRFGEIRQVYTQPGLKFKVPFIDQKTYFDKRLLYRDGLKLRCPTWIPSSSTSMPMPVIASGTERMALW